MNGTIGREIVKKLEVKFKGNEIFGVDDFDVFACYRDLWKTDSEKRNALRQGIFHSGGCADNCMKLRINASGKHATSKRDDAIAKAYRNSDMLDRMMLYYQSGLGNRLCYIIMIHSWINRLDFNQKYQYQIATKFIRVNSPIIAHFKNMFLCGSESQNLGRDR